MEYILPCSLLIYDSHHRQGFALPMASHLLSPRCHPRSSLHKCANQDRRLHTKRGSTCRGPGFHRLTPRSGGEPACCSSSRYDSCFVDMFLAIWISTSRLGPRSPKCSAGPWTYTECDFDLLALQVDLPLHHLMPNY